MNSSSPQILFPFDFSEQALIALDQCYDLARFYNAELTLLYVIDEEIAGDRKATDEKSLEKEMHAKLDEVGSSINQKHNIKVNTVIAKGRVYEKILEVAEMIGAKFIVMGTKGAAGLKKTFIGFYAMKVVKESKCPVITIRGKEKHESYRNIVLPIDLSKESREKVNNAIELGKFYKATIHVISVVFSSDEDTMNRLTNYMELVKNYIKKAGLNCTGEIVKAVKGISTIAQAIMNYANEIDADLIIITTQQGFEIMPLFIGSTAQDIINHSDIPVMSIVPSIKHSVEFSPY